MEEYPWALRFRLSRGGCTGDKLSLGLGLLSYLGSKSNDIMPASLAALVTFLSNDEELPL